MSDYLKEKKIFDSKLASCYIYWIKANGVDKKHYHNTIEFVYVLKGKCKTHEQGKLYVYKKGQVHEVINNSKNHLVLLCLMIPQETEKNTIYL